MNKTSNFYNSTTDFLLCVIAWMGAIYTHHFWLANILKTLGIILVGLPIISLIIIAIIKIIIHIKSKRKS